MPFNRTPEGRIDQRRFGGHTRNHGEGPVRRACYAADRTGHMILQTLYQQCLARDVNFFNEFQVLDIALSEGRVSGLVAYELATGDLHVFHTKAALFATGGYGRMFKVSSNAVTLTGDGPGVLYRRGIPMQDMEFFQFHPTGIYKLGILSRRRHAAKAASCATPTTSGSWSATPQPSRTWRRATWSAGRFSP